MPYIDPKFREDIDGLNRLPANTGELNYIITKTCLRYLTVHGLSYAVINEIVGALECAKTEFYRRVAVPHEEKKRAANGDLYPSI